MTTMTDDFEELFLLLGSVVALLTEAELITVCAASGALMVSVIVALSPFAIVPSEHVASLHDPCVGTAETNVAPIGSVSTSVTAAVGAGPRFVPRIVEPIGPPASTQVSCSDRL